MKTCLFKYTENFTTKNENFQINFFYIFHISVQNIDCGYLLELPNKYPQSMFLSRNKTNNVYPCKPQFYDIKVGFKGVKIIYACFRDESYIFWCSACCLMVLYICEKFQYNNLNCFQLTEWT